MSKTNKPATPQGSTTQNTTTGSTTVQRPTSVYIQNSMQSANEVNKGKKK
jgi:hypothetical protein